MFGKCPNCDKNARPVLLYGIGLCHGHWTNNNAVINRSALVEIASKTKPIKKVSEKKKIEDRHYTKRRKEFLKAHPKCEAGLEGCTKESTEVHHKSGRGKNYLKEDTWLAVCRDCHTYIEANPSEAKERGLSDSRIKSKTILIAEHDQEVQATIIQEAQ